MIFKRNEKKEIKRSIITAVLALGGWAILWGLIQLFGLRELSPLVLFIIGVILIVIGTKFGFKGRRR